MRRVGFKDPQRCDRCGTFWRGDVARQNLAWLNGARSCVGREACDARIRLVHVLDRAIARGRLLGPSAARADADDR